MGNVNITVKDRIAVADADSLIICNNKDYTVNLSLDDEWSSVANRTARIYFNGTYQEVIFTGDSFTAPPVNNTLSVEIGIYGGDLSTTPASVRCKIDIQSRGGVNVPHPDAFAQIMEDYTEILERTEYVQEAAEDANAAAELANAAAAKASGKAPAIVCAASGKAVAVRDSAVMPLEGLHLYGKTTQDGTPSPDAPIELVNIGAAGTITATALGANLIDWTVPGKQNNASFTVNEDGSIISVSGMAAYASATWYFDPETVRGATLHCSHGGISQTQSDARVNMQLYYEDGAGNKTYNSFTSASKYVTLPDDIARAYIQLIVNNTASALTENNTVTVTKPMVCIGTSAPDEWEPYKAAQTVTANTPNGLPGVPVVSGGNYRDSDGQRWICDEVDFARGVYVKRVHKRTFDGTEAWAASSYQYDSTAIRYDYRDTGSPAQLDKACLSAHFPHSGVSHPGIWVNSDQDKYAEFRIMWEYSTADELTAYLAEQYAAGTPVECMYTLRTPIETALAADELAAYSALRANKPNTTVLNNAGTGMLVEYVADTKIYIDNKFAELAATAADA